MNFQQLENNPEASCQQAQLTFLGAAFPTYYAHIGLALLECPSSTSPLSSPHLFPLPASRWVLPNRSLEQTQLQHFVQSFYLTGTSLAPHSICYFFPHSMYLSSQGAPVLCVCDTHAPGSLLTMLPLSLPETGSQLLPQNL